MSAAQELNIISPRAHTSLIGVHGTVEAGGVELSSGLQGTTYVGSTGCLDVSYPFCMLDSNVYAACPRRVEALH